MRTLGWLGDFHDYEDTVPLSAGSHQPAWKEISIGTDKDGAAQISHVLTSIGHSIPDGYNHSVVMPGTEGSDQPVSLIRLSGHLNFQRLRRPRR